MARPASIAALRRQIDRIDDQILALLNRRARAALAVAEHKARTQAPVYVPSREARVLARLGRVNGGPLPPAAVRAIFGEIISASRGMEQRLRIGYLGPAATWAHLAAQRHFGASAEYVAAPTIAEVFADVEHGRAHLGVVPVENSTEGMVAHTLDLLAESPLQICAEVKLSIQHCLLARPGTTLADVQRVGAHPQALAQCRRWLATHLPNVALGEEASNARAAARAAAEPGTAAIAAAVAADAYKLSVLAERIQDEAGNVTRFVVLGRGDADAPSGDDRTSIVVSVRDEIGVLAKLLRPFATHRVDLLKIESRPLRERPWEYYFFLDLKGHRQDARVARALAAVEGRALRQKVLGSYPAAPDPEP
ncbi:MAG: prephenate dehydratase [bacterium]|nr:prephenate dehydratase [bacterium]